MPSRTFGTAAGFDVWLKAQLVQDTEIVRKAATESVVWGERNAVALTNKRGAVDQGLFKLSWTTAIAVRDKGAELRNDAPYADIIERGRRPGRPGPPLQPIIGWVNRKLRGGITGQYRFARRLALGLAAGSPGSRSFKRAAVRSVRETFGREESGVNAAVIFRAMAIRDAIHIRGTKPRFILRDTWRAMIPRWKAETMRRLRSNKR